VVEDDEDEDDFVVGDQDGVDDDDGLHPFHYKLGLVLNIFYRYGRLHR
jgi:hypothetical protein